jgi:DNA-binding NarL/FixJ family response regulator
MDDLSPRQSEVAALVAEGFTGKEIADQLGISEQAVKNHKRTIYQKLGATNAVTMIRALMEKGSL